MSITKPFSIVKNLFKKPMTLAFPFEALEPVTDYRGRQILDLEKCVGCNICAWICPNEAIEIVEHNGKKHPKIHLGKCCFCGLCAEYCPSEALKMTAEAMISVFNKAEAVFGPDKLSEKAK
jgi:NADH-quinone oxidoreductase subunit I